MSDDWSRKALELVEGNPDQFMIVFDDTLTLMWIGTGVRNLLGFDGDDKIGRQAWEMVHANDFHLFEQATRAQMSSKPLHDEGLRRRMIELRLKASDGTWVRCQLRPLASNTSPFMSAFVVTLRPGRTLFEHAIDLLGTETALDDVLTALAAAVDESLPRCITAITIGSRNVDRSGFTPPWLPADLIYGRAKVSTIRLLQYRDLDGTAAASSPRISAASAWLVPVMLPGEPRALGALITLNDILDPPPIDVDQVLRPVARLAGIAAQLHTSRAELQHLLATDHLTGLTNSRRIEDWSDDISKMNNIAIARFELMPLRAGSEGLTDREVDFVMIEVARRIGSTLRPGDVVSRGRGLEFVFVLGSILARVEGERVIQRIRGLVERPIGVGGKIVDIGVDTGLELREGTEELEDVLSRAAQEMALGASRASAPSGW
jgi:GGDEF domain-containing protein